MAWKERLYFERLEQKSMFIDSLLKASNNDWEFTLFKLLAKNFGLNINGDAFLSIADSLDFSVVRKSAYQIEQLEALLLGQAGLLNGVFTNPYVQKLQKEYMFLKHKFSLKNEGVITVHFSRLRPPNFPTIRLAQLAALYHQNKQLFLTLTASRKINEIYQIFKVSASEFWDTHYTLDKSSTKRKKYISKKFVDLLLINTIIPMTFLYHQKLGKMSEDQQLIDWISQIPNESNSIISTFSNLGIKTTNALDSQALIHLKKVYCDKNACFSCSIGHELLKTNVTLHSRILYNMLQHAFINLDIILTRYGFYVCSRLADRLGMRTKIVRLSFIYVTFATVGLGFVIYLYIAFWLKIKDLIYVKRTSVFDL